MINNFNLLSSKNPYELHYNKDNLLDYNTFKVHTK